MANPAKVLNFFDPFGTWDPSLAFVMGGALIRDGHRLPACCCARPRPSSSERFHLPTATRDRRAARRWSALVRRRLGHCRLLPRRRDPRARLYAAASRVRSSSPPWSAGIIAARWLIALDHAAPRACTPTPNETS